MFLNLLPSHAALLSLTIILLCGTVGTVTRWAYNNYCVKYKGCDDKRTVWRGQTLKIIVLVLFSAAGLFLGNLITIGTTFCTAKSHGMTVDPNTEKYYISYGEMIALNRDSVKETNVDIHDLKNKAVIYVRYDCPDCVILHEQLSQLDDMIFLSSRTEKGKAARELYNISLTEIPQGVYIDSEGKATIIKITQGSGNSLMLDLQQVTTLQEMANRQP